LHFIHKDSFTNDGDPWRTSRNILQEVIRKKMCGTGTKIKNV
jgi:hypothetical protein